MHRYDGILTFYVGMPFCLLTLLFWLIHCIFNLIMRTK